MYCQPFIIIIDFVPWIWSIHRYTHIHECMQEAKSRPHTLMNHGHPIRPPPFLVGSVSNALISFRGGIRLCSFIAEYCISLYHYLRYNEIHMLIKKNIWTTFSVCVSSLRRSHTSLLYSFKLTGCPRKDIFQLRKRYYSFLAGMWISA